MMGMEKMLSSMIGMSPDEMQKQLVEFRAFVSGGAQALENIATMQREILDRLTALEAKQNG